MFKSPMRHQRLFAKQNASRQSLQRSDESVKAFRAANSFPEEYDDGMAGVNGFFAKQKTPASVTPKV